MELSIIIVNYNVYEDVVKCISSLEKHLKNSDCEIIVVDNNSEETIIKNLNQIFPGVKLLLLEQNLGFGYANNVGMNLACGKYFLLINPDILIFDDSVGKMKDFLECTPRAGIAAPLLLNPDKSVVFYNTFLPTLYSRTMQEFGRMYFKAKRMRSYIYDFMKNKISEAKPFSVEQVMGACMLIKREVYNMTNGFDEKYFLYEEETDWQYRIAQAGWGIYMYPECEVIHNHHTSISQTGAYFINFHERRSRLIYAIKYFSVIAQIYTRILIMFTGTLKFLKNIFWPIAEKRKIKKELYFYFLLFKLAVSSSRRVLDYCPIKPDKNDIVT